MAIRIGDQEAHQAYGPFHRLAGPGDPRALGLAAATNELWGRTPRSGTTPQVQAFTGELRPDAHGIEFWTLTPPRSDAGSRALWLPGDPLGPGGPFILSILVTRLEWEGRTLQEAAAAVGLEAQAEVQVQVVPPIAHPDPSLNDKFTYQAYVLTTTSLGITGGELIITGHHLPAALLGGGLGGAIGWMQIKRAQHRAGRHPDA
jgi:hypothetical protein